MPSFSHAEHLPQELEVKAMAELNVGGFFCLFFFHACRRTNRRQTFSKRKLDVLRLCEQFTDGWPCSPHVPWQANL